MYTCFFTLVYILNEGRKQGFPYLKKIQQCNKGSGDNIVKENTVAGFFIMVFGFSALQISIHSTKYKCFCGFYALQKSICREDVQNIPLLS
jgi:hypothetical protein